jgi:hypothetical protein
MKKVLALLVGSAMLSGAAAYVTATPVQAEQVR